MGLAREHRAKDRGRESKEEKTGHVLGEVGGARSCTAGRPESGVQIVF